MDTKSIAERFAAGGCCGHVPQVAVKDLKVLGIWPIPNVFESSLGPIAPLSGWKELCIYTYERLTGEPFPIKKQTGDPGLLVAEAIRQLPSDPRS